MRNEIVSLCAVLVQCAALHAAKVVVETMCADGSGYAPGAEKRVSFSFPRLAFCLEKGDRLRVDVSSACSQFAPHGNVRGNPNFVRTPKTAHNSIAAERSALTLYAESREWK